MPNAALGTEEIIVICEIMKGANPKKDKFREVGKIVGEVLRVGFGLECAKVFFFFFVKDVFVNVFWFIYFYEDAFLK